MPTITFEYTGAAQNWVVPRGVRRILVEAWGAQGGAGSIGPNPLVPGANGGYARGFLAVKSGQVLQINVGGQGQTAEGQPPNGGGFNGGGGGGGGGPNALRGGGGGGSDVRQGGTGPESRKIVAGGGGGTSGIGFLGGAGGGLNGESLPGNGATQTSGGVGSGLCGSGGFFFGGESSTIVSCAGGGGGWYGGGAGGGGGGGSSYLGGVSEVQTLSDQRQGNGLVILTLTPSVVRHRDIYIVSDHPLRVRFQVCGNGNVGSFPRSGSCFPIGTTRVRCWASIGRETVRTYFNVTVAQP